MTDKYQDRYVAHQGRKKKVLIEVMKQRHSTRMFSDQPVKQEIIDSTRHELEVIQQHQTHEVGS